MLLDPCHMQTIAALPSSQVFFKLHCMLHLVSEMNTTRVYKRELFGGKDFMHGCCSTQIDLLGEITTCGDACALYSSTKAQNTIDAILSSRHCKCKLSSPIVSLGCDCSTWSALHKHRWENIDTPAYQMLHGRLVMCEAAASKLQNEISAMQAVATRELELACLSTAYTTKALELCNTHLVQSQISYYTSASQ